MARSVGDVDDGLDAPLLVRRIRHIASIQVRNLTPFPVRDAFTSALSHSSESTLTRSFAADDMYMSTSRRRTRKISTSSVGSKSVIKWDDPVPEDEEAGLSPTTGTIRARKTSGSRVSFTAASGSGNATIRGNPLAKNPRPRTSSKASSISVRTLAFGHAGNTASAISTISATSSFLSNNSQKGLEKVINSRLLETCLVITVVEPPSQVPDGPLAPQSANHIPPNSPDNKGKFPAPLKSAPSSKTQFRSHTPSSRSSSIPGSKHIRSLTLADASAISERHKLPPDGKHTRQASSGHAKNKVPSPPALSRTRSESGHAPLTLKPFPLEPTQLQYLSPIHRPSTNPEFSVGSHFLSSFSEWTCLNAQALRVTIWGKMPVDIYADQQITPGPPPYPNERGFMWKVLDEWDVHLGELIPVPVEAKDHAEFPSNTLLLTLAPHGQTYRLPCQSKALSRPSSPSIGYSSDPEPTMRKTPRSESGSKDEPLDLSPSKPRRRGKAVEDTHKVSNTETWPDIFQLATLQACIVDNNTSLEALTRKLNDLVHDDDVSPLRREISERQDRIGDFRKDQHSVLNLCSQKQLEIQERRAELNQRRELLLLAREEVERLDLLQQSQAKEITSERSKLDTLRSNLASVRAGLVSVLADIFPVDLLSPPDLLFTILDVPLPIPVSSNDPAPPLTLPDYKQVNEDAIAAALGYVAEVLQLLSAYLGIGLLYPVTCIGSRSLIKDGISSMVGPRTFPLYSKGVDTYRFEYGVFLLNKNIELLMAEKDLRALDMRHTLPNLKNLLLILSHDTSGRSELRKRKVPDTPTSSILELDPSSSGPRSESREAASTPKPCKVGEEAQTPPRSGATTPTPGGNAEDSRKSRSFLGLTPLAGFLRSRYPSAVRGSPKETSEDDGDEEEEDRRTIHGVARDENGSANDATDATASAVNGPQNAALVDPSYDQKRPDGLEPNIGDVEVSREVVGG
ncbi:hypothetical protein CC2G_000882 [Coprinopsis cinerea AmutBmut pab1-1]|nr:hypothetical protein CC2G_000882 [Coprinopsis cinerea AmutBmut pab1-1]